MYEERTYRTKHHDTGAAQFQVVIEETDLWISADKDMTSVAEEWVRCFRHQIL